MKRTPISANLYCDEVDLVINVMKKTGISQTDVVSFFVRRGMKDFNCDTTQREVLDEVYELIINSQMKEYAKTDAFKAEVDAAVEKAVKEKKNANK